MRSFKLGLGVLLAAAACVVAMSSGCTDEGLKSYRATSAAMAPLIPMNAEFFVRPASPGRQPARGDVVVFPEPSHGRSLVVKRVVAVAGDEVQIAAKEFRLNGAVPVEPYAHHTDPKTMPSDPAAPPIARLRDHFGPTLVPEGKIFVLGDNRDQSVDSRFYGPIEAESVVGYVVIGE